MVLLVIMVAAPIVSGVIAFISTLRGHGTSAPTPNDSYKYNKERTDYPDIADQIDSRFTNIFRNPWKGIL